MAKVLIDIPEHNLNVIKRFVGGDGFEELPPRIIEDLIRSVYLGIVLDRLTNGEVIKKMFPNETKTSDIGLTNEYGNTIHRTYINGVTDFTTDWWNRKWGEA